MLFSKLEKIKDRVIRVIEAAKEAWYWDESARRQVLWLEEKVLKLEKRVKELEDKDSLVNLFKRSTWT